MTTVSIDTVAGVRDRILDAAERGASLRIVGRGTWLDAGRLVHAAETLSTDGLTGITEYVPGDLTLTALAGTSLGAIRAATAEHGQWLALDPHGNDDGTIGATVATGSAGPLSTSFGRPRDLVLGLEFVTGAGVVARGGGRVVKNVAGYDLTRLLTGSWGTLGVITEITVRLYAKPECDESIAIDLGSRGEPGVVRQLLRRLPFVPFACEVVNEPLANRLVGASRASALIRLGGNAAAVRAQRTALAELGDVRSVDSAVWQQLRTVESAGAAVFRLSALPSDIARVWEEAQTVARACPGTLLHASAARGIVRCIVPGESVSALEHHVPRTATTTRIGERLPVSLWPVFSSPGRDVLSTRIRRTFDPRGVLNPGIFGDFS